MAAPYIIIYSILRLIYHAGEQWQVTAGDHKEEGAIHNKIDLIIGRGGAGSAGEFNIAGSSAPYFFCKAAMADHVRWKKSAMIFLSSISIPPHL